MRPARAGTSTAGLDPAYVQRLVRMALAEDLAGGPDVTSAATIPADATATAEVVARAGGVLAGLPVAAAVFDLVGTGAVPPARLEFAPGQRADGDRVARGEVLATVTGQTRALLTAERTALNLLCHACGVATLTRAWVDAVAGTGAQIRDTRKTTPGLRALEKYAVRCGGGVNHRMSLADQALVKDNHVLAAGGVVPAFEAVRREYPDLSVEVECSTVEQVRQVVGAGADLVLLDNMSTHTMAAAVRAARAINPAVKLEASGNLSLARASEVAGTGVDYLSVGALTHSAAVLDIAMDLRVR
jgi:nicotinate-nucleotide pyrophosphorylase (carboxylating)